MTDEQRSQTGWIGVPKWVVILGRALGRLKHLDRPAMRKAEIYGTVVLGSLIFLFIVIRLIVG